MARSITTTVVAVLMVLAACGSDDGTTTTAEDPGSEAVEVSAEPDCAAEELDAATATGVFVPELNYEPRGPFSVSVECDISYKTSATGIDQALTIYRPAGQDGPLPATVFFHFNGDPQRVWWPEDPEMPFRAPGFKLGADKHARVIASEGVAAITFDYHAYPMLSDFGEVSEENVGIAVQDASDLVTYVRDNADNLGIDPGSVCFWALGTGSLVSAYTALAGDLTPQCVVVFTGTLSEPFAGQYDPVEQVSATMPPFHIVRANQDIFSNVGLDRFAAAAGTVGATQVVVERVTADHAFQMFTDYPEVTETAMTKAVAFVLEQLGVGASS
jgi:acetyl esterase/lipase